MSVAVYQPSYKFPAGILAFVVHGAFFALLYFGFSWQTQMPETMSVALWKSIPNDLPEQPPVAQAQPVPEVKPTPEVKPVPPPEVRKPDIVLPTKKPEPKKVEVQKIETKPAHSVETKKPVVKEQVQAAQPSAADIEADRQIAAQASATNRMVDEYVVKIQSKIRRNIVMPPDVPDGARVEFSVTLLPDGSVLSTHKGKPSGSMAYDDAVERAILKAQPLPLPPDANLARTRFRDLRLGFQPKE